MEGEGWLSQDLKVPYSTKFCAKRHMHVCMCVCLCVYVCVYVCVFVCVCVCWCL